MNLVVDVIDYDSSVHEFLLANGATVYTGWRSGFEPKAFDKLVFPGCKPTHYLDQRSARLFFNDQSTVMMFLMVHQDKVATVQDRLNRCLAP